MPPDPARPEEPRPDDRRPLTRGDLFGPDGPFGSDDDATRAYRPGEQGQYEPGQYQRGDPRNPYGDTHGGEHGGEHGGGPPGRNRSAVLAALLVLAVGVVAAGVVYIVFGDRGRDGSSATPGPSAAQTTTDAGQSPEATEQPSPTPAEETTDPADYEPIPADPWTDTKLDFGLLTAVQRRGDEVRITVNRATFLTGEAAKRKNGGKPPDNDYLIEDTNPRLRTFVLEPGAPIEGSTRLAGNRSPDGEEVTLDQFVTTAEKSSGGPIPVWLRHRGNELEGPVTALAEQYVP